MKRIRELAILTISAMALCGVINPRELRANSRGPGAQTVMGTVLGTVRDSHGAVIQGAQINVRNIGTGIERAATTSDQGEYYVPNVPVGSYEVTASKAGFKTELRSGVTVTVGASISVNFDLDVGDISEKVQITGDAPQVETTTGAMSGLVSDQVIRELPLNGRDWVQLATLQPGVVYVTGQQQDAGSRTQRGNGKELSISGMRSTENAYRIDGIVVNDYANAGPGSALGINLGVDSIQEFSVLTNSYSAEYGRTGGGVVNAVLKSGTNSFHGSGFEFLRNSALDARNFFDGLKVPPFRRNQFGGSIGGPIQQNRTFFFANYEGLRLFQSLSQVSLTLSPDARNGMLFDPTHPSGPKLKVIVNQKIVPYLAFFPQPNGPIDPKSPDVGPFIFGAVLNGRENYVVGKIDRVISDRTTLNGSYSFDKTKSTTPDAFNQRFNGSDSTRQNLALSLQHSFNPFVLSTTRFGVTRTWATNGVGLTAGAAPFTVDPTLGFIAGELPGVINVTGMTAAGGVGADNANIFGFTSPQVTQDLYWTRGRHNFKFGAYVQRILANENRTQSPQGEWDFGSIKNFLTLVPLRFQGLVPTGSDTDAGMRQTVVAGYFQDDFRLRQNLTLNLGLRYEMATVIEEVNGKIANLRNLTDPTLTIGAPLYRNPTLKNFEPRLGVAWDPFGDGKTAVRAGFGIYDVLPLPYILTARIDRTLPFLVQGTVANPAASTFPNQIVPLIKPSSSRVISVEFNPHRSYAMQYNVNVERQLAKDLAVMIGYAGSAGVHLPLAFEDVDVVPLSLTTKTATGQYQFPTTGPIQRINPGFGRVAGTFFGGHSNYNALLVNLTKRFSHGLTFQAVYRWSRSIDNGDSTFSESENQNGAASPYPMDMSLNRGPSDFDIPQNLIVNYTWVIPTPASFNGAQKALLAGWQLGGIFQVESGAPFTLTIAPDQARTGTSATGSGNSTGGERPNFNPLPGCSVNPTGGDPSNFINLSCFSFPALGTLGNLGRNTLRVPKLVNYDFSLFKNFNIVGEKLKAQFRAEAFNLFNHPSFQPQTGKVFDSNGNVIPSAARLFPPTVTTARQIQLGLKLIF